MPHPASATTSAGFPLRSFATFITLFLALQWAWSAAHGTRLERWLIDGATVSTAVAAINLLTPEVQAFAAGSRIRAPGGGIHIINGCEGTELLFLLAAAIVAFSASWRDRALGLLVGVFVVFVLNQVRVLALFYAFRHDRDLFSQLHGFVTPLLLIAATLIYFVGWVRWCGRGA